MTTTNNNTNNSITTNNNNTTSSSSDLVGGVKRPRVAWGQGKLTPHVYWRYRTVNNGTMMSITLISLLHLQHTH